MKLSEITYQSLFENNAIDSYYFDCNADDSTSIIGRDIYDGHHECEESFISKKESLINKYGDVEVEVKYSSIRPTGTIKILDENYLADKQAYIEAKGKALNK